MNSLILPFKSALVTGGAGFIGSHLVEALVSAGVKTISLDNYSAGKAENLEHLSGHPLLEIADCDVCDAPAVNSLLEGIDVVFHEAASKKTVCLKDPRRDLAINAEGTFNLLEGATRQGVRKFVHASTGSVYGEARYRPQDEEHPFGPTSYYGTSKLAGENYVGIFAREHGLDTTVLRYFHVYGPRQESSDVGGVVSIFIRRLLEGKQLVIFGDGSQERSFTWVGDVVRANLLAASTLSARGETYNCASGIKVTIQALAEALSQMVAGSKADVRYEDWTPGDIRVFDIDNSKIQNDLGLEFMTDFEKGLRSTVDWAVRFFGLTAIPDDVPDS